MLTAEAPGGGGRGQERGEVGEEGSLGQETRRGRRRRKPEGKGGREVVKKEEEKVEN